MDRQSMVSGLLSFLLMFSFSAVSQAQAISVEAEFLPPDATDDTYQAQSLRQNYSSIPIALSITLPAVTDAEQTDWEQRERTGPLQIGFGREIPVAYQDDLAPRLTWNTLSDGTLVSALSVTSPGAEALRVAVFATLPAGAELRFFSPTDPAQDFDPLTQQDFASQDTELDTEPGEEHDSHLLDLPVWSPVIDGETVGLEITLPSSQAFSAFSLYIDQVSHLVFHPVSPIPTPRYDISTPRHEPQSLFHQNDLDCNGHIDVACADRDVDPQASATAKMVYTEQGTSFLCTGTLLNDNDDSSFIPYFLTAAHCISTQALAETLDTYWDYEHAACGDADPLAVTHSQLTEGADLLVTHPDSDSTLLRLREDPPRGLEGRWYLGWDSSPMSQIFPTDVFGVHHPAGHPKKYSAGTGEGELSLAYEVGCVADRLGRSDCLLSDGITVSWSDGSVEGGSSGSGLFESASGRLVGVLSETIHLCAIDNGYYGSFAEFFPHIRRHLGDDPAPHSLRDDHSNTPGQATVVTASSSTAGRLERAGDHDYFRVTLSSPGTLTVSTTGTTDTVGELQTATGTRLASNDDTVGLNFQLQQQLSAGTYYIQVRGYGNSTGAYTLVVRFTAGPPPSRDDHGNTPGQATVVTASSSTAGRLERAGDHDYFRVTLSSPGTLTVSTTGTTDTVGELQTATGTRLASNDDTVGLNFQLQQQLSAGTYYIQVRGYGNSTGAYTLVVRFTAGPPPSRDDHGNTRNGATTVGLSSLTAGRLERSGDLDYFRVTLSGSGEVTVSTTGTTDTVGELQTSSGTRITSNDDGGTGYNFRMQQTLSAGTYYIQVRGYGNSTGDYELSVSFASVGRDDHSDTRAQATVVGPTSSATGRTGWTSQSSGQLERSGDIDYFRFTLFQSGTVTVSTTGTTDTVGELQMASGTRITSNDDGGTGYNFRMQQTLSAGVYYLKVTGYGSSTGAYTLDVHFTR